MAEVLTQVLQPEAVGDQREIGLDDDQVLGQPPRCNLQDQARRIRLRRMGSIQESTITPATSESDSVLIVPSRLSRSSLTEACLLTPRDLSDPAIGQALVESGFSIQHPLVTTTEGETKKPTWPKSRGSSATSAYSSTSSPIQPGRPSSSRPTTSTQVFIGAAGPVRTGSRTLAIIQHMVVWEQVCYFLGSKDQFRAFKW